MGIGGPASYLGNIKYLLCNPNAAEAMRVVQRREFTGFVDDGLHF